MKTLIGTLVVASCLTGFAPRTEAAAVGTNCVGAGNLVGNCGFESGDFSSWTLSGSDVTAGLEGNLYGVEMGADPFPVVAPTLPNHGQYQAYFSDFPADPITLSQTLSTTRGATYLVSFSLAQWPEGTGDGVADVNSSFMASFGGTSLINLTNLPGQVYTLYSFTVNATSASTPLTFQMGNEVGEFLLDDVSVTAVPLPSSLLLALSGLGTLGAMRRYRRQLNPLHPAL